MSGAHITYKGVRRACAPDETVLEHLERHGVDVKSSCRAGSCQSCMLRAVSGLPPSSSQLGLRRELRATGHFLACRAVPTEDLEVAPPGAVLSTSTAHVIEKTPLAPDIVRIRLRCAAPFDFKGGQFVQLERADGLVRSFSLASLPCDGFLELHVRRVRGGKMSEWLHDEVVVGDPVVVRGPAGECYYLVDDREAPLLLAGTGTGAAPLWAIVRDALRHRHVGVVHFFHAVRRELDLYLDAALRELERLHENVRYHAVVGEPLDQAVLGRVPDPAGFRVALCGSPDAVRRTTTRLYLAGASLDDISADAFVHAASSPKQGA